MLEVRKYPVPTDGPFAIELPAGARLLRFDAQAIRQTAAVTAGTPPQIGLFIWALVDPNATPERRNMWNTATGRPLPKPKAYIGTAMVGPFVFHLFEMPEVKKITAIGGEEFTLMGEEQGE